MSNRHLEINHRRISGSRPSDQTIPLKILILADTPVREPQKHGPYRLDLETVDALIAQLSPALTAPIVIGDESYTATIEFQGIDSFEPESVALQISLIPQLKALQKELAEPGRANAAAEELSQLLNLSGSPDSELSQAEPQASDKPEGSDEPEVEQSDFSRLIGEPAGSDRGDVDSQRVRTLIERILEDEGPSATAQGNPKLAAAVDEICNDLVRQVLRTPDFRRLERTWRGVQWLVNSINLDEGIELWLMPFSNTDVELSNTETPARQTEIFNAIATANAGAENNGFALIAVDYEIRTAEDVKLLEKFGEMAGLLDATVLSGAPAGLVPASSALAIINESLMGSESNQVLDAQWSSFQKSNAAHRTAAVLPRLLLRLPYGRKGEATGITDFEEFGHPPDHDAFLWGNPVYGLLLLVSQRFEDDGWSPDLAGVMEIEDMPIAIYDDGTGEAIKPPAEAYPSDEDVALFEARGVMTFVSYRNHNAVRLSQFHSVARRAIIGRLAGT